MPGTVVFLHAHPDDEAIFTGGTLLELATRGVRTVVVFATDGAAGGTDPGVELASVRRAEAAAQVLGVGDVVFWEYPDSTMAYATAPPGSFATLATDRLADDLADLCRRVGAAHLVAYDEQGIYGHPDHVQAHRVGWRAAQQLSLPFHGSTVDREYLHFVDTHLLGHATQTGPRQGGWGVSSVEVSEVVDVRAHMLKKAEAIAAHHSQVGHLGVDAHASVYGFEWYVRSPGAEPLLEPR